MKEQIIKYLSKLIAVFSVILFFSCQAEKVAEQEVWRFALEEIKGSVQHAYALKFKEIIERETKGEVKVKIYTYGTIGNSDQVTEQLATGAIQFAMSSPGYIGKIIPEVQVMLLHYLFSQNQSVNKELMLKGKTVDLFKELYQEKGFKLLAFYPEGEMVWSTNKKIMSPEDFAGVKMRVMTSPMLLASYKAYGASPVAMPYGEVYSALQLKMIDGQVNPIFSIEEMSFYEVTDYLTFSKCAQFVTSAVAGLPFWKRLSQDKRDLIEKTIVELQDYIFSVQHDFNKKRLAIIKKKKPEIKVVEFAPEQIKIFKKKAQTVRQLYVEKGGPRAHEVLQCIDEDLKNISEKM